MRRNRRNNIKRERIIMVASSAFVLAALTMTGVYMKDRNAQIQDDGYTLDFTQIEESADDKFQEIAQNNMQNNRIENSIGSPASDYADNEAEVPDGELDYMPLQVGSGVVTIPGLTDSVEELPEDILNESPVVQEEVAEEVPAEQEVSAQNVIVEPELHFSGESSLLRPVEGQTIMPFSMDTGIYYATLAQYKCNPAMVIAASEGTQVYACAQGRIDSIFENEEIGNAVKVDLGDGYSVIYGQLSDIRVSENEYVNEGDVIGSVAAPSIYYSVEGSNLYFEMRKDDVPVNPETMFR